MVEDKGHQFVTQHKKVLLLTTARRTWIIQSFFFSFSIVYHILQRPPNLSSICYLSRRRSTVCIFVQIRVLYYPKIFEIIMLSSILLQLIEYNISITTIAQNKSIVSYDRQYRYYGLIKRAPKLEKRCKTPKLVMLKQTAIAHSKYF